MFRTYRFIALIALLSLVLSACGYNKLQEAANHWEATVALENEAEQQYSTIVTASSEGYQLIVNKHPLAEQCFTNSQEVITAAVEGRYDNNAGSDTSAPSGQVNSTLLDDVLVVNEAYPGDISRCQDIILEIARDTSVWRQSRINLYTELWSIKRKLDTQYTGQFDTALRTQLLQLLDQKAREAHLTEIPRYVYPTFNLEAISRDEAICKENNAPWSATINGCKLTGQGAFDYIFKPITAAPVQRAQDTGIDDMNPNAPQP